MMILTAGGGIPPIEKTSIDLVYHRYEQDHANRSLRDAGVKQSPRGRDTDLGSEVDLIFGYRAIENLKLGVAFGAFNPGGAYAGNVETSYFMGFDNSENF